MSSRIALRGSYRQHSLKSIKIGRPSPQEHLEVTLVLRRKQPAAHPHWFDMPLSHDELENLHGADANDIAAVDRFASLHQLSVTHLNAGARTITLSGTVSTLSSIFGADMELHRLGDFVYRSRRGHLHVPRELNDIVIAVLGFDTRPAVNAAPVFRPHAQEATSYTPRQIANIYNFPKGATGKGETIAMIELGGGYRNEDLQAYWKALGLNEVKVIPVSVNGVGNRPAGSAASADGEVMLDIEVAGAVAPEASIVVYFAPNTDQGFLNAINAAIHDRHRKPSILSISWGSPEDQWPRQSLDVFNQAFHDAALLGISVFCAAGDNGSSDGEKDDKPHVDFPASSPWVVACGGTSLRAGDKQTAVETVWNNDAGTSATGGGVSTFFSKPDYQANASIPLSTVRTNFAGRGVPDVAGCADPETGYRVLVDGEKGVVGGTSAVAPLWAGLTALLNQQLRRRVGFFNTALYGPLAKRKAFNDIISGTNGAYTATTAWDACTGLGSPNGQAILDTLRTS